MTKYEFKQYCATRVHILDGAMGTQLQKHGMPKGVKPEAWVLENPDVVRQIQSEYIAAGSDIIYAPTFGANAVKLAGSPLADDVKGVNARIAALSRSVAGSHALVGGDISPLGVLLDSSKGYTFDRCVDIYKEQIEGLAEGGVDFLALETFIDIEEARAAAIAARETCPGLPLTVTFAFDENGRLLTGADALTALFTMADAGADAVGANCGVGPGAMLGVIRQMSEYAAVPLIAKPNAGLPKTDGAGNTYFDMGVADFCRHVPSFAALGVALVGGCCGTAPEYIAGVKAALGGCPAAGPAGKCAEVLTSPRAAVFVDSGTEYSDPIDLASCDLDDLIDEVLDASDVDVIRLAYAGAADEIDIAAVISTVCSMVRQPLAFDFADPALLARAKRLYCGIAG